MKLLIKRLQTEKDFIAANQTIEDFLKIHGNILSIDSNNLLIDFPDAIDMAHPVENTLLSRITPYQLQIIFDAGNLFSTNYRIEQICRP